VHPRGRRPRPRSQMAGKACEYCHTLRRSKALPPLNVQSTGQRTGHPAHATADSSIQGMSKETAPVEMRPGHGAGVPRQAVLASACVQEKIDYRMFPRKGTIWDYRYRSRRRRRQGRRWRLSGDSLGGDACGDGGGGLGSGGGEGEGGGGEGGGGLSSPPSLPHARPHACLAPEPRPTHSVSHTSAPSLAPRWYMMPRVLGRRYDVARHSNDALKDAVPHAPAGACVRARALAVARQV
jgi:hypothetical protein